MRFRNLREAFRSIDCDHSGALSRDELHRALLLWHIRAQGRHVDEIIADFDKDGDEALSYAEWCEGLKPFSVSHPVFGLADQHVTDRHRVLPNEGRVLLNDNLTPLQPPSGGRGCGRPDYELFELPHGASLASPDILQAHRQDLADRIHDKYKNIWKAFRAFDENKDGKLSKQEVLMAVRCFNLPIPREHVLQLIDSCDANGDGLISYNEFASVLKRKDALGQ